MASIEFNAAWWKKNGAKTLTGSGMEEALKAWEGARKSEGAKLVAALTALHKAATVAEKKANKTLHKETIGYLQAYQKKCMEFIVKVEKADGSSLATPDKILTKPVLALLGSTQKGKFFTSELTYLFVTKGKPDTASAAIYNTFISESAAKQVNLPEPKRKKCDELAGAETWTDKGWNDAHDAIWALSFKGTNMAALKIVLAALEAEPVLNEIRAA
ncbi:MAG: hypothetical protein ACRYG6_16665 [Janthinobacterium lividum]